MKTENLPSELITSCMKCPYSIILPDPDPYDWFCDDDVRVFCKKEERNITTACRPYNATKESVTPDWCPINKQLNKKQ